MVFLLFAVLYTAESGKHIILLKFVPCLSKKNTHKSIVLVFILPLRSPVSPKKGEVKKSTNIFWHPGGDLGRWWLHRMLSKSLGLVHLLPSEILYRVCGWSSSDKPMATAEQTTSLASSWHSFSQESSKHTSFCSLFCFASSCKP